jgi:hypothetical protein
MKTSRNFQFRITGTVAVLGKSSLVDELVRPRGGFLKTIRIDPSGENSGASQGR